MSNLCSTDFGKDAGSGADRYPMLGTGSKLLIVKKNSTWTNREFFIPQDDEYFACAVAYGVSSTYNSSYSDTYADGNTVANRVQQVWNGTTTASWNAGHKSLFWYCARGFGPWFVRNDSKASSSDLVYCRKILEMGGSRQLLHFNTRAFPAGMCSSFKAYLRFWCPSWLQGLERNSATYGLAFMGAWNNGARVYYKFSPTVLAPYEVDGANSGYCDFANGFSNEGKGSWAGTAIQGTLFDPWGSHLGTVSGNNSVYQFQRTLCYKHYNSSTSQYTTDYYYNDHEITDANALKALKDSMRSGGVWCHLGFNCANLVHGGGSDTGQFPFTTMTAFASRVDLRLVMSCPYFNR